MWRCDKLGLETCIMTGPILGAVGIKTRREGIETDNINSEKNIYYVGIKTRREGIETNKYSTLNIMTSSELKPVERVLRHYKD